MVLKSKYKKHEGPISKKHVDIDKIVVSNKVPFGKKGFRYLLHVEKTLMNYLQEQAKTIILKCFQRNVNMLLKKKRFISMLLMM